MKKPISLFFFALLAACISVNAQTSTKVIVRAQAKDAKFIGTSMGGALITIRNANSGELLAKGVTEGSTGNTSVLVREPRKRNEQLSTPGSAKFEANLTLEEPVFVTIAARAPYAKKQAHAISSTQLWLIPGKNISEDGIILEVLGFVVDILSPQTHSRTSSESISIKANIVMMCGCPTKPGGVWNSNEYDIKALIYREGEQVTSVPLRFAGTTSTFEGEYMPEKPGVYKITVYAYHPSTGNTGVDKTTVIVSD